MPAKADSIPDFCDMCGRPLDGFELDYLVRIEVISGDVRAGMDKDLVKDLRAEIERIIRKASAKNEVELMDEVYRRMEFRICPPCQKEYLQHPIPRNFKKESK
jgi:hypothetical protein